MKRSSPEHDLQKSVVDLLNRVLPADAFFTAINPLPGSSPRAGANAKRLGVAAGVPDILIVHNGLSLWLELKAKHRSATDVQREVHRKLLEAHRYPNEAYTRSGTVVVCKSIDEVRMALQSHRMTLEKAA